MTCQTHSQTVVNADGTKQVSDSKFALLDVDPTADFVIESCGYTITSGGVTTKIFVPQDTPCPAGATCTDSGTPFPNVTSACNWSKGGIFLDGKLYISCGSEARSYNAGGTLTATTTTTIASIKVHH